MDPCRFVRLTIDSLALRLPETASNKQIGGEVHPSSTPCYCKLRIKHFPSQKALLPLSSFSHASSPPESSTSAPGFHLDAEAIRRVSGKNISLRVSVYAGRTGHTCGVASGKLLGRLEVAVDLAAALSRTVAFHSGWMKLGGEGDKPSARLHLLVERMVSETWFRNLWRFPKKHEGHKEKVVLGVLAFEVASLLSKLVHLWQSLSDKNVARLRGEITHSTGIKKLVSEDDDFRGLKMKQQREAHLERSLMYVSWIDYRGSWIDRNIFVDGFVWI